MAAGHMGDGSECMEKQLRAFPSSSTEYSVCCSGHSAPARTDVRKDSSGQRGSTLNHSLPCGNVLWDQVKK